MTVNKQPLIDHPGQRIDTLATDTPNVGASEPLVDHPGFRVRDRMEGEGPLRKPVDGFQREEYRDRHVVNCGGVYKTGNCDSGDNYWKPTSGNWWDYPDIGGTPTNRSGGTLMTNANPENPSSYDFVGGQTTGTSDPLDTFNGRIDTGYSVVKDVPLVKVNQRDYNNCNCGEGGPGTTTYNCYTNCNCACACACACDCDCACFPAGTPVTMGDGTLKPIEAVVAGDRVLGAFGMVNKVIQVDPVICPPVLWEINDGLLFTVGSHRLWIADKGWGCIDPDEFRDALVPAIEAGYARDRGLDWTGGKLASRDRPLHRISVGTKLAYGDGGYIEVEKLTPHTENNPDHLYGLVIHNGSGSYTVAGGLWSTGYPDWEFDFDAHVRAPGELVSHQTAGAGLDATA